MKYITSLVSLSLCTLLLTACGTNDTAMNDTAARNTNPDFRNVTYNAPQENWGSGSLGDTTVPGELQNNGRIDARENNQSILNTNTNNNANTNNNTNNNDNQLVVADRAAEKIADMKEVDRANVIVTENNAYVAVKLKNGTTNNLSGNTENKINKIVKSTDRNIDHVYVSLNPEFYTRTTQYANDIRAGHPIEGFFDEFGELVRRVFPAER